MRLHQVWNDFIASMASDWGDECKYGIHGQPYRPEGTIPFYGSIGQNIFVRVGSTLQDMLANVQACPYRTIIYDPYLKNHTWIIYDIFFMNYVRKWPLSYMKSGPLHTWIMLRFYMSHGIILTKITYGSYIWHIWKCVDYIWIMYDKLLKTHNNHVWFLHMSYMNHTCNHVWKLVWNI